MNEGSNFVDDAIDVVQKMFNNAHQKTIQKIEKDGRPIQQIEKYLDSIIKNDIVIVKQILRVCFSAYTNNPINLAILAPTSEGKTYSTVQITNLFPTKDVIAIGRMSPTALIHQNGVLVDENGNKIEERIDELFFEILKAKKNKEDKELCKELEDELRELKKNSKNLVDLTHKILLFLDSPQPNTYEMLKPILSHDKKEIIYKTTSSDGTLKVKETIIRGWPATIICSAKNEAKNDVWDEITSRFFMASPNIDIKKYKAANYLTADIMGVPTWADHLYTDNEEKKYCEFFIGKLKETFIKLYSNNNNPIFNPYRKKLVEIFPSTQGIDMRHFNRFNSFCNIETILHARDNVKIEWVSNEKVMYISVITSLYNIDETSKILSDINVLPPDKVKFFQKVFKNCIMENLDSYGNDNYNVIVTSRELADQYTKLFKKPTNPKKIVQTYLNYLVDEGLIVSHTNPDNKSQNNYMLGSEVTNHDLLKCKSVIIDNISHLSAYVWLGIVELGKVSIKYGKIQRLYNSQGTINYTDFLKLEH